MNDVGAFLERLVGLLDALELPYMLAGSFASTYHGVPRTTQDVDVVVDLQTSAVPTLLSRLPEDEYYVSEEAVRDAVRRRSQFNIIDLATGWKADLILRKERPFSHEELGRRQRGTVLGVELWLASAEDTILTKLEWAQGSGSTRQLDDVRGIIAARGASLDTAYIERWAADLGLFELWDRVRSEV